jgi:8-oxo-dGTP pyrophosphatase MutT (NUDIX family)
MTISYEHTLALLERHQSTFSEEQQFIRDTLLFIQQHETDFWQRSTLAGHLTGSAWVLSADRQSALLIHHQKLDKWFQPGGHGDAEDGLLIRTAQRELAEECGLFDVQPINSGLFDLDVHSIPAKGEEPKHLHYDLRFLFCNSQNHPLVYDPSEIKGIKWVPLTQLTGLEVPSSLRRMALKSIDL